VVYGYVKGNVHATGRIEIRRAVRVGNLTTAQIMIERRADFKVSIEIDRSAVKNPSRTSPRGGGCVAAAPKSHLTILLAAIGV